MEQRRGRICSRRPQRHGTRGNMHRFAANSLDALCDLSWNDVPPVTTTDRNRCLWRADGGNMVG